MNIVAVLIHITIGMTTAVVVDLVKYANALSVWSDKQSDIDVPNKPRFLWQLFVTRLAIGAIGGFHSSLVGTAFSQAATQPSGGF